MTVPWMVPVVGVSSVVDVSAGGEVSCPVRGRVIKAKTRKQKDRERNKRLHNTGWDDKAALSWEQNVAAFCVARVSASTMDRTVY